MFSGNLNNSLLECLACSIHSVIRAGAEVIKLSMEWGLNEHSNCLQVQLCRASSWMASPWMEQCSHQTGQVHVAAEDKTWALKWPSVRSAVQAKEIKASNTPAGLVIFWSLKVLRTFCFYSVLRLILPAIFTCCCNVFNDSGEEAVYWITSIQTWRAQLLSLNLNIIKHSFVLFIRHEITTDYETSLT